MALEFTNIPDRTGPAIYIFGDGTSQTEKELLELGTKIDELTPDETQVVYLDPSRGDGLAVKEFYALTQFPAMCIIMDDDTIHEMWSGTMPRPEEVSYELGRVNG